MKLIIFITLISLAFTFPFSFRGPSDPIPISDSAPSCISDFFTALFAKFDLDQPNQIIQCFDEKSAWLYFRHFYELANLAKDTEDRDNFHAHLDWLKILALHKPLESVINCALATEDFTRLLEALGGKRRDPHFYMLVKYIYFQANFGPISERLHCLTDALDQKNYTLAGHITGCIANKMSSDIKSTGLALQALNGLWNGVHIGLGLPDAESVWGCWNNETASLRLEFIHGLAKAVAKGSWKDASYNSEKWYEETGNDLLAKIPKEAWQCWKDSKDTKAESEKLKVDIASEEFWDRVNKFTHGHQATYWHLQKTIHDNLHDHNFIHAGSAYGHLLQAAAATK